MPSIVAEEQQEISIVMIQDQLIGDLFRFDFRSKNVTLAREFKDQIIYGKGCPIGKDVVLTFQVTSSVIGVSRPAFIVIFQEDLEGVLNADKIRVTDEDQIQQRQEAEDGELKFDIVEIQLTGELTIRFSQPLLARKDIAILN